MTYFWHVIFVHFLCPEASGENEPKEKALFRPDRSGFEGFLSKYLQKPATKSYLDRRRDQGFIRQPAETLLVAYTDEKEWPISTSAYNNLRHVP
jgi:hypothetical protein